MKVTRFMRILFIAVLHALCDERISYCAVQWIVCLHERRCVVCADCSSCAIGYALRGFPQPLHRRIAVHKGKHAGCIQLND